MIWAAGINDDRGIARHVSKRFLPMERDAIRSAGAKDKGGVRTDVRLRARRQVTWVAVLVRWDPVEGKVVCQDWALVRQDKAVLPAATPVAVAVAAEWLGRASECLMVLNPERR